MNIVHNVLQLQQSSRVRSINIYYYYSFIPYAIHRSAVRTAVTNSKLPKSSCYPAARIPGGHTRNCLKTHHHPWRGRDTVTTTCSSKNVCPLRKRSVRNRYRG